VSTSYAIASIAVSGAGATTMGFNVFRPSTASGVVGLVAGAAALLTGAARTPSEGDRHTVAVTNMVIGGGAMLLGVRGLVQAANRHATSASRAAKRAPSLDLALAPAMLPGRRSALGLLIRARF
jgi:hypothetical protein